MKILNNLKKNNEKSSMISIALKDKESYQGDKVVINIITQTQPPNGVTLELQEFWYEKQMQDGMMMNVQQFRNEEVFTQDASELFPGVGYVYSITVQLPKNCRTSTKASGWQVVAKAEEQAATKVLEVLPAVEFLTIISVCERRMRFKEKNITRHWSENGYIYFRMQPPNILKSELESLTLAFSHNTNNMISVGMTLKLKEKSKEDYFQNMLQPANIINTSFQMDPNHLFMEDGTPNTANITGTIIPLIQKGIERSN
jgi:hypothetical protein